MNAENETPHSDKWHARRNAIIDLSAKVFAQRGYHGTSTIELCEANQLGKGALYYYIGSKEQLLVAIHDRVMDQIMLGADRVATAAGTPPEQLALHGQELLDVIVRYPDHVWVFLREFHALTGESAEQFRRRRHEYERQIEDVIAAGKKSGHFRQVDPRVTTQAWLGMHNTYLWLQADGRLSAKQIATSFADIFMRGLMGP